MGEAKRRRGFRVVHGGGARVAPPRLVNHTVLIEQGGHEAIERARQRIGVEGAMNFDLLLIGCGLGAVSVPGFIETFQAYVAQIETLQQKNPAIPHATIQDFAEHIVKAGLAARTLLAKAEAEKQLADEAARESVAAHVEQGGGVAPDPDDPKGEEPA